jgi:hypothetical protein
MDIQIKTRVKPDGVLDLHIPTEWADSEVDVKLSIQPLGAGHESSGSERTEWPADFFERTFGSLKDSPLEREPQGEYEVREGIA